MFSEANPMIVRRILLNFIVQVDLRQTRLLMHLTRGEGLVLICGVNTEDDVKGGRKGQHSRDRSFKMQLSSQRFGKHGQTS